MADIKDDIERYRKGAMSAAEIHALEKRALTDPFLADALDGADSMDAEHFAADVAELQHRMTTRQKASGWFSPWRMAAVLALVLAGSYLFFTYLSPDRPVTLAKQESKTLPNPVAKTKKPDSTVRTPEEKTKEKLLALDQARPPERSREPIRMEQPLAVKPAGPPTAPAEIAAVQPEPVISKEDKSADEARTEEEIVAPAKEKTLRDARATQSNNVAAGANKAFESNPAISSIKKSASKPRIIRGIVTSSDHTAIPGVNVVVKGTNTGTVTDANGAYQINLDEAAQSLVFAFIGYSTREEEIKSQSTVNVQLFPDVTQLSEVVVTGYGLAKDDADGENLTVQLASPAGGQKLFDQYLRDSLRYPLEAREKKVEGRVIVEFTVQRNGTLSGFTVVRGVGAGCSEELIRLIKDGPPWTPNRRNAIARDSKVRVRLKFSLPVK